MYLCTVLHNYSYTTTHPLLSILSPLSSTFLKKRSAWPAVRLVVFPNTIPHFLNSWEVWAMPFVERVQEILVCTSALTSSLDRMSEYRECPHCNSTVSTKVFKDRKRLYFSEESKTWIATSVLNLTPVSDDESDLPSPPPSISCGECNSLSLSLSLNLSYIHF